MKASTIQIKKTTTTFQRMPAHEELLKNVIGKDGLASQIRFYALFFSDSKIRKKMRSDLLCYFGIDLLVCGEPKARA